MQIFSLEYDFKYLATRVNKVKLALKIQQEGVVSLPFLTHKQSKTSIENCPSNFKIKNIELELNYLISQLRSLVHFLIF